eukprot:CAMPEP_0203687830 /NCGR_PEP_ID=MMETSP0091-20130426/752_1 /ASSEMBLY_ACC=CAM_ASM_001089 /TAXON_ID=426623 /ORGANISM="Chaetoceros affinis, Strain CCMP159" /LENGTH=400 /DNA_ID=CAMNT_0050557249 /DNA_START=34 /DNA_END=1236 /DNA_ORIENTATION=-
MKTYKRIESDNVSYESAQESLGLSDEGSNYQQGVMFDSDIRNAELVIDEHNNDPFAVMRIQTYDDAPMAKGQDEVVLKIEASTVSSIDCQIRDGTYQWKFGQKPAFPIVPGVDCVGVVTSCGALATMNGIAPGDRVASFQLHGCNAKYKLVKYTDLVRVPEGVDPAEAVAMIRTYTAAFQALMQGIHGHGRYSRKPLLHKRVLIVGPCGTFERALVELGIFLGAKKIYFSAHSTSHSHENYIRLLGAKPLDEDPDEWLDDLEGKIDIAIDSVCIDRFEHTFSALDEDGILVAAGMADIEKCNDFISNVEKLWTHTTIKLSNQCTYYHGFIHEWENEKERCMKDLVYLYNLLANGKIKPKIATRIPMLKVAAAQERLDQNLESMERRGIVVVDPWLLPVLE